jgi:hypothetical protein
MTLYTVNARNARREHDTAVLFRSTIFITLIFLSAISLMR